MTHRSFRVLCLIAAFAAVIALATCANAQAGSTGSITVIATDATGGVVPGAALELVDTATNDVRRAITREDGSYTFVNLLTGEYRLGVSRTGYQSAVASHIIVHAALTTDVAISLQVGASSQSVQVNASTASLLETTSNAIGTVVDMKQIEDLPLAGRDLTAASHVHAWL